ncbi:MAG TPA: tetratricopeptide repeat protein [Thermoanaerobaculia bacterium]|nr:tetratricopeptide repeat protein [Thermoanaerobaculia bacterium]
MKHDKFVDEIGALSSRARQNQRLLLLIAGSLVAVALIIWGIYFFRSSREAKAQAALASAIETSNATVQDAAAPNQPPPTGPTFKTEEERNAAADKQFKDVQDKFSGTDASDVAGLYIARGLAAKGDATNAKKILEDFIDDHGNNIAVGSARYSLYQLRIDSGEAVQVTSELNGELAKADPILPGDSLLLLLAHAYEVQGNAAKTREAYKRITTEFPDSPYAVEAARRAG